jgi:hypothetical protein
MCTVQCTAPCAPCVCNTEHVVEADIDMQARAATIHHLYDRNGRIRNRLHLNEAVVLPNQTKNTIGAAFSALDFAF